MGNGAGGKPVPLADPAEGDVGRKGRPSGGNPMPSPPRSSRSCRSSSSGPARTSSRRTRGRCGVGKAPPPSVAISIGRIPAVANWTISSMASTRSDVTSPKNLSVKCSPSSRTQRTGQFRAWSPRNTSAASASASFGSGTAMKSRIRAAPEGAPASRHGDTPEDPGRRRRIRAPGTPDRFHSSDHPAEKTPPALLRSGLHLPGDGPGGRR